MCSRTKILRLAPSLSASSRRATLEPRAEGILSSLYTIEAFAFHPSFRGQYLGRRLLEFVEDEAREQNINWLRLDCWSGNEALLRGRRLPAFYRVQTRNLAGRAVREARSIEGQNAAAKLLGSLVYPNASTRW